MVHMNSKHARVLGSFVLTATLLMAAPARAQDPGGHILVTQRDTVKAFDLVTGKGSQVGTSAGLISGTTSVEFQFSPTGPPVGDAAPAHFTWAFRGSTSGDRVAEVTFRGKVGQR